MASQPIVVRSNIRGVRGAIERIVAAIALDPNSRPDHYAMLMSEGVMSHFQKLRSGGTDGTALEGSIHWPGRRSEVTKARRVAQGLDPVSPMLVTKGTMKDGYRFPQASARPSRPVTGKGSRLEYTSSSPRARQLADLHQTGGRPFRAQQQGYPSGFTVPERRFLYWDQRMKASVDVSLIQAYRKALAKEVAKNRAEVSG